MVLAVIRIPFWDVFRKNPDGTLTTERVIIVKGVRLGRGVTFGEDTLFGGINLHYCQKYDIQADEENGVLTLRGFFRF